MIKRIFLLLLFLCIGCTKYATVSDVEFATRVTFENNAPVFTTTYTVTIMNISVNKVVQDLNATVAIVTGNGTLLKKIPVSVNRLLPKQVHQVQVTLKEAEQDIKPLLTELEIDIDKVIQQQEAALVLPEALIKISDMQYGTVDIVHYLQEVGK